MVKYLGIPTAFAIGTTDVTTSSELLDAAADFVAEGVQVGDKVFIQSAFGAIPSPPATVTSVSTTSLGLTAAIAGTAGENYYIYAGDKDPTRDKILLEVSALLYPEPSTSGQILVYYSVLQYSDVVKLQSVGFGSTYTNGSLISDAVTRHWEKLVSTRATDSVSYMDLNEFYDSVNDEWAPIQTILIG